MDSVRHILRLLVIARTLARHDALFILEQLQLAPGVVAFARIFSRRAKGRPGERLARAFQHLGPTFIKLGQMLSTRSDLLGEEMAADLSHLQDALPPFSEAEAKAAIEAEFERPLNELFSEFKSTPVAAASIAQVHFAITTDDREVAVKVLRPGVEKAFQKDLDLFYWGAQILERTRPELRRLRPVESVRTLARSVELEMDLRFEASAADELKDNFKHDPDLFVPAVDWQRTGMRVLTTERVHGVSFGNVPAIVDAGHDRRDVLAKTAHSFFHQVFRDGLFHGDMHPGNLFVMDDGRVAVVDFGIMGRLDKDNRRFLAMMLMGFLTRDYRLVADVHFEAGWIPKDQSRDEFTQACRSIGEPVMDRPQNEISIARLLGQLFQVTETFQMETQPQLLLLQKTLLVAEGTGRALDPDANMWMIARPLIEKWMRENLGPEARIKDAVQDVAEAMRKIPSVIKRLESALDEFDDKGLKLHPETVRQFRRGTTGERSPSLNLPLAISLTALAVALLAVFTAS